MNTNVEIQIINCLANNMFSPTAIGNFLNIPRQNVEYYIKKFRQIKLISKNIFNFDIALNHIKYITISDKDAIIKALNYLFIDYKTERSFFIEPKADLAKNKELKIKFDNIFDTFFSKNKIIFEGIIQNGATDIIKENDFHNIRLMSAKLSHDKFFIYNPLIAQGKYVIEVNYEKLEIYISKNESFASLIRMYIYHYNTYLNKIDINSTK